MRCANNFKNLGGELAYECANFWEAHHGQGVVSDGCERDNTYAFEPFPAHGAGLVQNKNGSYYLLSNLNYLRLLLIEIAEKAFVTSVYCKFVNALTKNGEA